MRTFAFISITLCAASALGGNSEASAADPTAQAARPTIAPPPDWVLPAAIPSAPKATEGAASINLLSDIQKRFAAGGDSTYVDFAFKIASAEALTDVPLEVSWDPSLETLTLHRYRILRDGQARDLLGDGGKLSIIQRETNMESAALDGELTATMQPDDVRVGDIVEVAFTRTRNDPALAGHSESLVGPNDGTHYGRLRVRFTWPDSKKIKWRAFPGVLQPKQSRSAAGNELVADLMDVRTAVAPAGAPGRFRLVNAIDISEFPNWGAVSAAVLPLYSKAAKLEDASPVRAEAQRIAAETSDPTRRAEMALQLVQEQIRYLYIGMNDGGYVPAAADLTWSRRFGDCKGKAVLLVALLRELGIEAEPVLVNTENGDLLTARLPSMAAFDHVIVRARVNGRTYWMDGTNLGDTKLARLEAPSYKVGLPIAAGSSGFVPIVPPTMSVPSESVSMALDASAGIDVPARASGEMRFRGASAAEMRLKYSGLSAFDRDQQLRELWRKSFDQLSPSTMSAVTDESTGDFVVTVTGSARMEWFSEAGTRWYEVDRSRLGWKFDTDRDGAINKDAPFAIAYPDYWESRETIKLPAGGAGFKLQGESFDRVVSGVYALQRKVKIEGDVVTMEASTRALAPELPAAKADETQRSLAALQNNGVYVRVPANYMATDADLDALKGDKEALAKALRQRGALRADAGDFTGSIADEDAALKLDPNDALAHAIRAISLAAREDDAAVAAADLALKLDSKQWLAWHAKGVLAIARKRYAEAEGAFSRELALNAQSEGALAARAAARMMLGRNAEALADADDALAISPLVQARLVRASALAGLQRQEEALAEIDRAVAAQPDERALLVRAEMRSRYEMRDAAIEDYTALIKLAPKADYYLSRSELWGADGRAERDRDIDAAVALEPGSAKARAYQASAQIERGDFKAAEAGIAVIEAADRNSDYIYRLKLQLLQKQGRGRDTLQLVDAFIAKHPDNATALNERCWIKATLNIRLETAIADCDAALKIAPESAAILDSRAFARLRLEQVPAAIEDYNAALKIAPKLAASLYGRAIARARSGDAEGARADIAQARKIAPEIDGRFAEFGIELPSMLAAPAQAGTTTRK